MKPFLLLAVRADDAAADNEYESFLACTGLHERDLRRYRLEQRPLGGVDLQDWSGDLLGGGPFTASDPEVAKSPVHLRQEADLRFPEAPEHVLVEVSAPAELVGE